MRCVATVAKFLLAFLVVTARPSQAIEEIHRFSLPSGSIGSIALEGSRLYVGNSRDGLTIYDVTEPTQPVRLGAWAGGWSSNEILPAGDLLYTTWGPRLRIFDVSNPSAPRLVSETTLLNTRSLALAKVGAILYVASLGIEVFDVSDPAQPVRHAGLPSVYEAVGLAIEGTTLIWTGGQSDGLHVVDISEPAALSERAFHAITGISTTTSLEVGLWDELARVNVLGYRGPYSSPFETRMFDVSDPESPQEVGRFPDGASAFERIGSRTWTLQGGVGARDDSDPTAMVQLGQLNLYGARYWATNDELAFVVMGEVPREIAVVRLTLARIPSHSVTVAPAVGRITASLHAAPWLYVIDDGVGLRVFDATFPNAPVEVATLPGLRDVLALAVQDGRLYAAGNGTGLLVVDVANPLAPQLLSTWERGQGSVRGIAVHGRYVLLADVVRGLRVVDVSLPFPPPWPGTPLVSETPTRGQATRIQLIGPLAYAADGSAGLTIYDVSDVNDVQQVGAWDRSATSYDDVLDVHVVGGIAYLASLNAGFQIVDVSQPATPTLLGQWATSSGPLATAVTVVGPFAYTANGPNGGWVLDVSDPTKPLLRHMLPPTCLWPGREVVSVHPVSNGVLYPSGTCGLAYQRTGFTSAPSSIGCGLGPEVGLAVALLLALRRVRACSIRIASPR